MILATPLAWLNLTHEKRRLVTALAGVGFAVLLMFIFQGFQNALYDSQVQLQKLLNGDAFVINRIKQNMFVPEQFARRRLYQARAFEGVEDGYALYMNTANWKNPDTKATWPLRVLAFNLEDPVLLLPGVVDNLEKLRLPNTAIIDLKSQAQVGGLAAGTETELSDRQVKIVGTYTLGTDFASGNGNLIMSDQNFLRYFASLGPEEEDRTLNTTDVGILKFADGVDVDRLVATLQKNMPNDVTILSKQQFIDRELNYWRENTNIGFVFSLLTVMSFFVGIILVYQILYTDVSDHWAEYATLKAIGYSNWYLLGVVLQEALFLAILGFLPGLLISIVLYDLATDATGLLMVMTFRRALNIQLATFLMCVISGFIAVRKVQAADPAEVFG
ncbi:DevC protein [Thalassoporum mexicanum PCC 7367]|uniref:ABC transporter permease DevC n=1 Tax=Thalassoporum mexicanum TaxID=3457544 RepID=UPI00029FE903|nr:ABC transporter permease DevC [Pseudanabaena sp. PCC 7367]AFY71533.1 DevC protein [Pseudanabaena sp. PCC 7367]